MSTKKEEKKLNGKEEEENIKWFHELRILVTHKTGVSPLVSF